MKIGFLILHYKNFSVTDRCVKSIRALKKEGMCVKIYIVDNGSCDESSEKLTKAYGISSDIELIILNQAYGFSRGNNIGYEYIKAKDTLDYLVVTNNDIVFHQEDFLNKIVSEYEQYHYYVLGPDMIDMSSGAHLNPKSPLKNREEMEQWIETLRKRKKRVIARNVISDYFHTWKIYGFYSRNIRKYRPDVKKQAERAGKRSSEFVIQGGCLVFSRDFLDKNEKVFWPETVFYVEESILCYRCKKNQWLILYSPEAVVLHEQGSSFRMSAPQIKRRVERSIEYTIESANVYLNLLNAD